MRDKTIKYLSKILHCLKNKKTKRESSVISLAPKILTKETDLKVIRTYLDELERSLEEQSLTNIAITGAYGSGKSTIIKTFQHLHPEYEYLNISLASFKDNDENGRKDSESTVNNKLERRLEISILQQIFYHVRPSEIPDSRFKRINNTTWWKLFLISSSLIIWLISTFILFKFDYVDKINPFSWNSSLKFDWITFFSFCIFFTGIGFFAKYIVRLFSNSKINKFSIKGELELGDDIDKSVFNEHLEEIIYFFERTSYNVVIIEDLDRFETTDIFTKLRELNTLLNTSKLIKREINFVYAVKDELFSDKNERVKFFDYIIPIIPFINASNAGVKLSELIKTRNLENVLTSDFIQDIVSFIDDIDMRLLINIFHEFCIYRNSIPVEVQDNLFAMIVYKNMYPDDFGRLSKHEGLLYKFISNKAQYIKESLDKIEEYIGIKEIEIKNIEKENNISVQELRAVYLNRIRDKISGITDLSIDKEKINLSHFLEDEYFSRLIENQNSNISYYQNGYGIYSSNITFSKIATEISSTSYEGREKLVLNKSNNQINKLKVEIEKEKKKKIEIKSQSLQEIFLEVDIDPYLGDFSNNQMMRSLLINGYINEDYEDYITLFHEGNITRADETFKRKVKSGISSPFNYSLSDKVGQLVKEIPEKYFRREVILNFNLLDFLCEDYINNKKKFNDVMSILGNEKENSINFIEQYILMEALSEDTYNEYPDYITRKNHLPIFINSLCKAWPDWWNYIAGSSYSDNKKKGYLKIITEFANIDEIKLLNRESNLSIFIEQTPDFLALISHDKTDKVKGILKSFEIKFTNIEAPIDGTKILFDYIYDTNHYKINENNILLMLNTYSKDVEKEKLNEAHFSTILKSDCKQLIDYIKDNISSYIKNVFLKIEENIKETEDVVINLLNDNALSIATKKDIIRKQDVSITDISIINDNEVQQRLIEDNKIIVSWHNLYLYYATLEDESDLDETLVNFLNNKENYNILTNQAIRGVLKLSEDEIKKFSLKIINCDELDYESYIKLLKSTPYTWNSLNFEHLSEDKVKWMVDTSFLTLTVDNFEKLKKNFPDEHLGLIEKQQDQLFSIFDELSFEKNDIIHILRSKNISIKNKLIFIEKIDSDFIIENKEIAKLSCDILAYSDSTSLDYTVINGLVNSTSLRENRIRLLNKQSNQLSNSQLQHLTETFGWDYQKLFKKQNKPTFTDTDYHRLLFDNLRERGLIIRYEKYKDNQLKVFANY